MSKRTYLSLSTLFISVRKTQWCGSWLDLFVAYFNATLSYSIAFHYTRCDAIAHLFSSNACVRSTYRWHLIQRPNLSAESCLCLLEPYAVVCVEVPQGSHSLSLSLAAQRQFKAISCDSRGRAHQAHVVVVVYHNNSAKRLQALCCVFESAFENE